MYIVVCFYHLSMVCIVFARGPNRHKGDVEKKTEDSFFLPLSLCPISIFISSSACCRMYNRNKLTRK